MTPSTTAAAHTRTRIVAILLACRSIGAEAQHAAAPRRRRRVVAGHDERLRTWKNPSPDVRHVETWVELGPEPTPQRARGEAAFSSYFAGLFLWTLVGSAGAGRADEELLAIRERDVTPVGAERAVLGLE